MDSSASISMSSNSAPHLIRAKEYLSSLLSDSSQNAYVTSMSASHFDSVNHASQVRDDAQSFRSTMSVLSDHRLALSMASSSSAPSSESNRKRIRRALSQLDSNILELQEYLNSRP